jgi:hypothetical protein
MQDLTGPDLTDLMFLDLPGMCLCPMICIQVMLVPGIIQNAEPEVVDSLSQIAASTYLTCCARS